MKSVVHVLGKRKHASNKEAYVSKGDRSITKQALYDSHATEELVDRVRRDVRRGQYSYLTPYLVSERYSISMSTAKKILKELVDNGVVELFSPGRRSPIYVPIRRR